MWKVGLPTNLQNFSQKKKKNIIIFSALFAAHSTHGYIFLALCKYVESKSEPISLCARNKLWAWGRELRENYMAILNLSSGALWKNVASMFNSVELFQRVDQKSVCQWQVSFSSIQAPSELSLSSYRRNTFILREKQSYKLYTW